MSVASRPLHRRAAIWMAAAAALPCLAPGQSLDDLAAALAFENANQSVWSQGWSSNAAETVSLDSEEAYAGEAALRVERDATSTHGFSFLGRGLPQSFVGDTLSLRGWLRTQDVGGGAALWLRLDGQGGQLEFADMERHEVTGTTAWTRYEISIPLNPEGRSIVFGVELAGTGTLWADELELLIDGRPVFDAESHRGANGLRSG